jgi:hypothetical protein
MCNMHLFQRYGIIHINPNLYWKLKASFVQFSYYKAICRGYTYKHKIRHTGVVMT